MGNCWIMMRRIRIEIPWMVGKGKQVECFRQRIVRGQKRSWGTTQRIIFSRVVSSFLCCALELYSFGVVGKMCNRAGLECTRSLASAEAMLRVFVGKSAPNVVSLQFTANFTWMSTMQVIRHGFLQNDLETALCILRQRKSKGWISKGTKNLILYSLYSV